MPLCLYNTLNLQVEPFVPADGKTVRMYTCGPTVYNFAHIGNLRTFTFEDVLRRWLKARGYHSIHLGKWHLGGTPQMRPQAQGFDESVYMESGLYLPVHDPRVENSKQDFDPIDKFLWPNMRFAVSYNAGHWFEPKRYLTDYLTDEAVNAIHANKDRPFFMYLAHWAVHTPLQAFKDKHGDLAPDAMSAKLQQFAHEFLAHEPTGKSELRSQKSELEVKKS